MILKTGAWICWTWINPTWINPRDPIGWLSMTRYAMQSYCGNDYPCSVSGLTNYPGHRSGFGSNCGEKLP